MGNCQTTTPSKNHEAVSSVEQPKTIFISDDESEDLLPSEIFNRKLASDLGSEKKSKSPIIESKVVEEPAAVGNIEASTKRKREKVLEEKPKPKISDFPPKKKRRLSMDLFSLPLTPPPLETLTPEKM